MMTKEELIRVYQSTMRDLERNYYISPGGNKVEFRNTRRLLYGTKLVENPGELSVNNFRQYESTKIYVQNIDTFEKVAEFGQQGACLNMASSCTPGGGVTNGSRAQEESLCRRSNLLLSLRRVKYPLSSYSGIYSPCVNIYKNTNYKTLQDINITSVISVSAVKNPTLTEEGRIERRYIGMVMEKIRTILRIAMMNKKSKLVLGAFGCGAYGNPAEHVAELFHKVLNEAEFIHSFEEICFAIIEDNNSKRLNNKDGNLVPFVRVFGEYVPEKQ